MTNIKVWPHLTIIALLCAVVGGVGGALWIRHRDTQTEELPAAARVERVDGDVGVERTLASNSSNDDNSNTTANTNSTIISDNNTNGSVTANNGSSGKYTAANLNTPLSVGDRIYAGDKAKAAIALTGRNFVRLNAHSALDVLALSDSRTQLALREGSAVFNVGHIDSGSLFEVATPCGAVDLTEVGLYQVSLQDSCPADVAVLNGHARVLGVSGTGELEKGNHMRFGATDGSEALISALDPVEAGEICDDYYNYEFPKHYDGRYRDYSAYLSDPTYYDPYNRYASYQYTSDYIPGVEDLDDYGDWQNVSGYGYAWHPRVDADWAPYQEGYWENDYGYGPTWVSSEAWGYAPYHYGRWTNYSNQWYWIPDRARTRPIYSPALVAFVSLGGGNQIGWVALGPGDPYSSRYYGSDWRAHYYGRQENTIAINVNFRGAVNVIPANDFGRRIDRQMLARVDQQQFANSRPFSDPMSDRSIRTAALQSNGFQRRVDVPRDLNQRLTDRNVIASTAPARQPFRNNLARSMGVQGVTDTQRAQSMRVRNEGGNQAGRQPVTGGQTQQAQGQGQAQPTLNPREQAADARVQQRMSQLSTQSAAGNQRAGRELQRLQQQQANQQQALAKRQQAQGQASAGQNAGQRAGQSPQMNPQGERVAQPLRGRRQQGGQQPPTAMPQANPVRNQARPRANQQSAPVRAQPQVRPQRQQQPRPVQQPRPQAAPRSAPVTRSQGARPVPPFRPQAQPRTQAQPRAQAAPRSQPSVKAAPPAARPQPQAQGGDKKPKP